MTDIIPLRTISLETTLLNKSMEKVQQAIKTKDKLINEKNQAEIDKASSEMESLFLNYLLKEMRATIPESGFISGGNAEKIYTSMLDSQIAKDMSLKGGIGLSALIREHLSKGIDKHGGDNNK